MSVFSRIAEYHRGREPERLAIKYQKMTADPFAFFRGTPNLFYEDWKDSAVAETPLVWLCGDLHIENFGTYRGDNRSTYFDFNDFDEACLGPASWDLARLVASVAIEALEREWRVKQVRDLCEALLDSYATALTSGKARWIERETAQGIVQDLFQTLGLRTPLAFLAARTELHRRHRLIRTDGAKALPLADKRDAARIASLVDSFGRFHYLDAARRVAGNSSLGVPRFVVLVENKDAEQFLLDLKQAGPPVALVFQPGPAQPKWKSHAARVVEVQSMVQAIPPAFLRAVEFDDASWVLRELMPGEDRVDVAQASTPKFIEHAKSLGQVVAWGHLRSGGRLGSATIDALIHFGERRAWRVAIARYAVDYAGRVRKDWEKFCREYQPTKKKARAMS